MFFLNHSKKEDLCIVTIENVDSSSVTQDAGSHTHGLCGFVRPAQREMGSSSNRNVHAIASCSFSSTFVADNTDNFRSKITQCPLTSDIRRVGPSVSFYQCVCPRNPCLQTCAVVSHRRLASLCMSLIPAACEVKCWQRITNHIRILKRPESASEWKTEMKRVRECVCGCAWVYLCSHIPAL